MDMQTYAFLCVICVVFISQSIAKGNMEEVCKWETFHVNCTGMSVIFVSSARFGRIQRGKCAQMEATERPCFIDVLTYVDKQCGGRKACDITLPVRDLDTMSNPCTKELTQYLEISYHCQEVYHANQEGCIVNSSVPVLTPVGYLANIITDETNQGSSMCPWTIQLQQGESVKLTLLDFATYRNVSTSFDKGRICHIYAVVKDSVMTLDGPGTLVCEGQTRETVVLTIVASVVQISVSKLNNPARDPIYFLIKFEVFGRPKETDTLNANAIGTSTSSMPSSDISSRTYSTTLIIAVFIPGVLVGLVAGASITATILLIKFRNKATARSHDEQMRLRNGRIRRLQNIGASPGFSVGHSQETGRNYSELNAMQFGQTDVYTSITSEEAASISAVGNPPISQMPHYDYVTAPIGHSNSENGYLSVIG